jgi:site-specific recombinase XerD
VAWAEQLPSGKWRGAYRDADGKKRRGTAVLHKKAALRWAENAEQTARRGFDPDAARMPLSDWLDIWWAARIVERTTEASDRGRLKVIKADIGDVQLERLTSLQIQRWVKQLSDGRSGGTVKKYFNLLSSALEAAVRERILPANECRHVQTPTVGKGREIYLTEDEVASIAAGLEDPWRLAVVMLPYTGMRWGELAGLHVRNIDMLRQQIAIVETLTEADGKREVKPYPKSDMSRRVVPLPNHVRDAIATYLARNPRDRNDLLLRSDRSPSLSRHRFWRVFRDAREAAGVEKPARPHDLRHSGASWLVQAGVSLRKVQAWLGHESITTTERYSHLQPGVDDSIRAVLDRPTTATDVGAKRGGKKSANDRNRA